MAGETARGEGSRRVALANHVREPRSRRLTVAQGSMLPLKPTLSQRAP